MLAVIIRDQWMRVIFLCLHNSLSFYLYLILQTYDGINSQLIFQPFWLTSLVSTITSNHIKKPPPAVCNCHFYMFISIVPFMTVVSYLIHCCPPAVQTLGCVGEIEGPWHTPKSCVRSNKTSIILLKWHWYLYPSENNALVNCFFKTYFVVYSLSLFLFYLARRNSNSFGS